jgi:hypothetical protein
MNSFYNPICSAFKFAALKLSMVDGKPGLTAADFMEVVQWTVNLRTNGGSNAEKATLIADAIIAAFGSKLPNWPWIPYALGWAAHYVAKRLFKP